MPGKRMAPMPLAAPVLLASALLPWQAGWVCALGAVVVLGVPHGALDVEIGRTLLRPSFPRWWFPLFALPYLLLVGLVLLAWRVVPEATLATFLLASAWHFGTEDTGGSGLPALAWGGLPVAVPVLLQPDATARILSVASGAPFEAVPFWLLTCSLAWLILLVLAVSRMPARAVARFAALFLAFAALPPLSAFALYFVGVHAPAHVAALVRHPSRAPRVRNAAAAWRLAAPTTLLTIAIGAATWPVHSGSIAERLLAVTLQLLAALTLPHMVLNAWLDRRDAAGTSALASTTGSRVRDCVAPITVRSAGGRGCAREPPRKMLVSNPFAARVELVVHLERPFNAEPPLGRLPAFLLTPWRDFCVRSYANILMVEEDTHCLLFSTMIIALMVGGTLVVLFNLYHRMM